MHNIVWIKSNDLFSVVKEKLYKADTLLDIDCGIRPQEFINPRVHICCEPFEQYISALQDKLINTADKSHVIIKATWKEAIQLFPHKSIDSIFLLDIIEHLPKEDAIELLRETIKIARHQIVIFTPLGFFPQYHPDGKDAWGLDGGAWQEHKSGWTPDDFDESWYFYASKDFIQDDNLGKKLDIPHGVFFAIKNLEAHTNDLLSTQHFSISWLENKPLFSIIVPTFNQANFLPEALNSLLAQTYSNWEALVVNDGSTDNTPEVMGKYAAMDKRIRLFHKQNGGVSSALNEGLQNARGEWICWLSSDDLFEPDKTEIHLRAIQEDPKIKFFYTHFYYLEDKTGLKSEPDLWNPIPDRDFQVSRFFLGPYIHGNSICIHHSIFDRVDMFDETYRYGQDFDMWLRISALFTSQFINRRTCVTRWHKNQTTNQFPEAGFYDSARACSKFLNSHTFTDIFPLLDLTKKEDIQKAIQETINLSLAVGAIMHRCGYNSSLIFRLREWLASDCLPLFKQSLAEYLSQYVNSISLKLPVKIKNTFLTLLDVGNSSSQFIPHDFISETKEHASNLLTMGREKESKELQKYLAMISSLDISSENRDRCHKILFYYAGLHNPDKPLAGTSMATVNLAAALAKTGKFSRVCVTGDFIAKQEVLDGVEFLKLPPHEQIIQFIKEYDAVVFCTHLRFFADTLKPLDQKWILHQHCWAVEPPEIARISDFDAILCLSDIHRNAVLQQGVPAEKLEVLPNFIDTKLFFPHAVERRPHSIMFAGAIVPLKGVHKLIEAFNLVCQHIPDAELHVYGSASMWRDSEEYEKSLKSLNIPGVLFHNLIPNNGMPDIYSQHSILCLPSEIESFSLVSVEAQACGCIPIVHNTGGTIATLIDGQTGFLYKPNTPDILAATIIKVLSYLDENNSIRRKAEQFVAEHFESGKIIEQFKIILQNLLLQKQNLKSKSEPLKCNKLETPVLFLIFNRPDTTEKVFNAIRQAKPKQLFIAADGPRQEKPGEFEKCQAARKIVEQVDWDCDLQVLFRDNNLGCKKAVSSGITWFFDQVDEGIILEDDCLPDQSFFGFCQELLKYYRNNPKIMHISGNNFQFGRKRGNASYYFSIYNHIWGWATWKRAWQYYDVTMADFEEFKQTNQIEKITRNKDEQAYWMYFFEKVWRNEIDTWDYQNVYSMWKKQGLAILPNVNLVSNIGFVTGATHTNPGENRLANMKTGSIKEIIHPPQIVQDEQADQFTFDYIYYGKKIEEALVIEEKMTKEEAAAALVSVGRSPLPAFQKFIRPRHSSPQMDEIENRWWNTHGELVEKVWSLQDDLCDTLRRHYLEKAKKFFLEGKTKVKVLELGCGSGWLGRILADESFQLIGTDFSETQIQLAKEGARTAGKDKLCMYYCTPTLKSIPAISEVSGVIMHAFLHHLYGEELDSLLSELQDLLPNNSKMFILEPVYHNLPVCANAQIRLKAQQMIQDLFYQMNILKQNLMASGQYDTEIDTALTAVVGASSKHGYFFSPKEVPFEVEELRGHLGKHAKIINEYLTGLFDTDIAQMLSHITDDNLRNKIAAELMPKVQFIDNLLIEHSCMGDFAGSRYIFTAYECEFLPKLYDILDSCKINHSVETEELSKGVNQMLFNFGKNFFGPVILNPGTLSRIATDVSTWQEILLFHSLLATDEYVKYLDAFYREGIKRFGSNWYYLDIVNVLYAASKTIQPRTYLEIGVRRGRSVCAVSRGCPSVDIAAFDIWMPGYAGMDNPGPQFVQSELGKHGHSGKISFINGDSHQTIPAFFKQNPGITFDMITVDGDHTEAGAFDDLKNVIPRLSVGGILVFDDISHPAHPYLLNVWRKAMLTFPYLAGFEYTEMGYGVAFAIRKG